MHIFNTDMIEAQQTSVALPNGRKSEGERECCRRAWKISVFHVPGSMVNSHGTVAKFCEELSWQKLNIAFR